MPPGKFRAKLTNSRICRPHPRHDLSLILPLNLHTGSSPTLFHFFASLLSGARTELSQDTERHKTTMHSIRGFEFSFPRVRKTHKWKQKDENETHHKNVNRNQSDRRNGTRCSAANTLKLR